MAEQSKKPKDQVRAALVEAGRATITAGLSADYLAALLDTFERTLTPREVVQSFYKNPLFPLVAATDEIRGAIFALLRDGWELADSDGDKLAIASPDDSSTVRAVAFDYKAVLSAPGHAHHGIAELLRWLDERDVAWVLLTNEPMDAEAPLPRPACPIPPRTCPVTTSPANRSTETRPGSIRSLTD
jgi:hypothetical protein